jgi:hypothetical protein
VGRDGAGDPVARDGAGRPELPAGQAHVPVEHLVGCLLHTRGRSLVERAAGGAELQHADRRADGQPAGHGRDRQVPAGERALGRCCAGRGGDGGQQGGADPGQGQRGAGRGRGISCIKDVGDAQSEPSGPSEAAVDRTGGAPALSSPVRGPVAQTCGRSWQQLGVPRRPGKLCSVGLVDSADGWSAACCRRASTSLRLRRSRAAQASPPGRRRSGARAGQVADSTDRQVRQVRGLVVDEEHQRTSKAGVTRRGRRRLLAAGPSLRIFGRPPDPPPVRYRSASPLSS